nr:MAG TPA: hypothetical protein [Caudoviricetes sp.]
MPQAATERQSNAITRRGSCRRERRTRRRYRGAIHTARLEARQERAKPGRRKRHREL